MTMAFDPANWRDAAIARKQRFANPPNAKPDHGINIVNGKPVRVEPEPPPVPAPAAEVIELDVRRLIRQAEEMEARLVDGQSIWSTISRDGICRPAIGTIQRVVAGFYSVSVTDILSARRTAKLVRPRQVAMYLAKQLTLASLPEIGRRFGGRDHTTCLHGVRKITALRESDDRLRDELQLIVMRLCEATGLQLEI